MRRDGRNSDPTPSQGPPSAAGNGAYAAMDQMAHWVRFADTKATILTAGLGVVLTMLINNTDVVIAAIKKGCLPASIVGIMAALTLVAFLATLYFLIRAIGPRRLQDRRGVNRFAWPSLVGVSADQLATHAAASDATTDAWAQVSDLARVAHIKFRACELAVRWFGALVVLGFICIVSSHALVG